MLKLKFSNEAITAEEIHSILYFTFVEKSMFLRKFDRYRNHMLNYFLKHMGLQES